MQNLLQPVPAKLDIKITKECPTYNYIYMVKKFLLDEKQKEIMLSACGETVSKLLTISSVLSESIVGLHRFN